MPGFSALLTMHFCGLCSSSEHWIDVCHCETTCNHLRHIVRLIARSPCLMPLVGFHELVSLYFEGFCVLFIWCDVIGHEIKDRHFEFCAFRSQPARGCHFDHVRTKCRLPSSHCNVEGKRYCFRTCADCSCPTLTSKFFWFSLLSLNSYYPRIFFGDHLPPVVAISMLFSVLEFDATLGFPGEGPIPPVWTISTANIGSLKTNPSWKYEASSVQCLQETRIGCNNLLHSKKSVKEIGKQLFTCAPLKGFIRSDGQHSVMHGGTAILAPPELSFDFDPSSDLTGLYAKLFASHRANACWVQVTSTVRILVFSIYAKTSASSNPQIFGYNDELFADIFSICAQFGSIPIILAGDFQSPPLHYPSISNAVNFHNWFDPLTTLDDSGESFRPLTYSKDSTFSGHGDFCSSIDGILVNQVASCAMQSIEVVPSSDSQHRPVRAMFSWPTIWQHGFVHQKFAPLVTDSLDKPGLDPLHPTNINAESLWDSRFENSYHQCSSFDSKWNAINQFCCQTLLVSGASWGHGPNKRGELPSFQYKQFCPGQAKSGSALSLRASWL